MRKEANTERERERERHWKKETEKLRERVKEREICTDINSEKLYTNIAIQIRAKNLLILYGTNK